MDPLPRQRVVGDTIDLLTREIAAGRLGDRLPSSRNLAQLLEVSRPTVLEALKAMAQKGLLEQTGPRRIYSVSPSIEERLQGAQVAPAERHALYILEEKVIRHESFEVLLMLATRLHPKGWRISSLTMNFGHKEYRPRQWKRAIEGFAPDKVIVWSGRPHLAKWLHKSGIPALFIGGDKGDTPVPVYATPSRQAVERILECFFAAGHERIWFPFCNRPDAYTEKLQSVVASAFESRGLPFANRWHTPVTPYRRPEVILAMFEEAWRQFRPTALMFHDWREYLAVSAILRREGLDIPKDMSIALIGEDPEMSWHQPELAHFVRPLSRMAGACAAWLTSEKARHADKSMSFTAEWVPGGSIAAPRAD
jgi:DNA-binding LacI/PurR family transcriptional regulator/DNA-binding transcriptional regulator YhcF (GntR family)